MSQCDGCQKDTSSIGGTWHRGVKGYCGYCLLEMLEATQRERDILKEELQSSGKRGSISPHQLNQLGRLGPRIYSAVKKAFCELDEDGRYKNAVPPAAQIRIKAAIREIIEDILSGEVAGCTCTSCELARASLTQAGEPK